MHKFIPMLQAMKILDAKAAVEKEWEKLKKVASMATGEGTIHEICYSGKHNERENESPLCYVDGHLSSQECGVRTEAPKNTKDESCSEVTL